MNKKKSTLKARGIRFSDEAWEKLTDEADKKRCYPSDIVRGLVDDRYKLKTPKKKAK